MVLGIGNDIIEIQRIEDALDKHKQAFIEKLLTKREITLLQKRQDPITIAGRFAAKEAISKALGVGFGAALCFHDIEIVSGLLGKPCVFLSEKANNTFGSPQILVSISHSKTHATAVAIWAK